MQKYSQVRAMLAITKASLKAMFRSPSAVVFSFIFPFIFIIVFGFIGNSGNAPVYRVVIDKNSDTSNAFFDSVKKSSRIRIVSFANEEELRKNKVEGRIAAVLKISKTGVDTPAYSYQLSTTNASDDKWPQLLSLLNSISNKVSDSKYAGRPSYAVPDRQPVDREEVREYKTIDFILPGQLGFSLLSSGVFGVAFMFFGLRNTLVLKRFFATPISRPYIVLGEAFSRVIFQMITAVVIILVGHFWFGFTLVNGVETLLEMLFLSFIGLLLFMGFGFVVSGLAKNDGAIPPFANLITMPQFLLCGTFFSIDAFPTWLQHVAKILPLTYLNTSLRSVAFEGAHFWNVTTYIPGIGINIPDVVILLLWSVAIYIVAIKVFKWE